jgi:hypothetical protein
MIESKMTKSLSDYEKCVHLTNLDFPIKRNK